MQRAIGYIVDREGPRIEGLTDAGITGVQVLYARLDDGRRVIGRAFRPEDGRIQAAPLQAGDRVLAECFFDRPGQEVWEFRRVS